MRAAAGFVAKTVLDLLDFLALLFLFGSQSARSSTADQASVLLGDPFKFANSTHWFAFRVVCMVIGCLRGLLLGRCQI